MQVTVLQRSLVHQRLNLFVSYYYDSLLARQRELHECIERNVAAFDRVFLIGEKSDRDDVTHIPLLGRPTYSQLFGIANALTGEKDINVIANLDVHFAHCAETLRGLTLDGHCLALSRHDDTAKGLVPYVRGDSQDAWVFCGKIRSVKTPVLVGKAGSDNRIAHELQQAGYTVVNPSRTLVVVHVHRTGKRNYTRGSGEVIPKPYFFVPPTRLLIR